MSRIRVTCLLCDHPVDVPIGDVLLHLVGTGADAANHYGFTCPSCNVYIVRRATAAVVKVLLAADVRVARGGVPPWETGDRPGIVLVDAGARVEQRARPAAPPITEADVLLFRKALEDDGIMAAWLNA